MKRYLSLAVALLLIYACTSTVQKPDVAITNVSIVYVKTGEIIENQNVVISDGKISSVSQSTTVDAETVIDGSGKFLMPGLWDMHVHFRGGDSLISENKHLLNLFIANGVTTVRDAGGDLTPSVLEWRKQIEAGELTGPQIFTSGPKLDGPDPTWAGSIEIATVEQVPSALDSLESLDVDYVKFYDGSISKEVYLAVIEEAEKRGLPSTGHMPFTVLFEEAVISGLDATDHLYYVFKATSSEAEELTQEIIQRQDTGNPLGFWEALSRIEATYSQERANQTYALMKEHGTAVVPTLHIGEVLTNMTEDNHSDDEYLNYIGTRIQKTYERRLNAAKHRTEEDLKEDQELDQKFMDMTGAMQEAGVTILAGSDSGPFNSFTYPGISLHKELEAFVEAGLSPAEALRTSVINGPAFFGVEDNYGQVKAGYIADLLLLNSNPLNDITNTRDIHSVILKGEKIMQASELNRMLKPSSN